MTSAYRVTERQSATWPTRATKDAAQAEVLDALIELTKPAAASSDWHPLLRAPFRYGRPTAQFYAARFRPPITGRSVLYSSGALETAAYEAAFHFMRQRRHLKGHAATEERLGFSLTIVAKQLVDIRRRPDIRKIMDKNDYTASFAFIQDREDVSVLMYPSCRDPKRRVNYAVFTIESLSKDISGQQDLTFFFDGYKDELYIRELPLTIKWSEVG